MADFHDVRFPANISLSSTGGPERRTHIVTLASGHEERNAPWSASRRRYDAGYGVRGLDDLYDVIAFFEARRGRLHGFRWKDWADFRSGSPSAVPTMLDQQIGIGDGGTVTFMLKKTYVSGAHRYQREIRKPVAGSVLAAVDAAPVGFAVDDAAGTVTLNMAPPTGAVVTAGFEFDVPVRFDTDQLDINLAGFEAGEIPSIPIVEVRF